MLKIKIQVDLVGPHEAIFILLANIFFKKSQETVFKILVSIFF